MYIHTRSRWLLIHVSFFRAKYQPRVLLELNKNHVVFLRKKKRVWMKALDIFIKWNAKTKLDKYEITLKKYIIKS